jgi:hypothetical protein
VTEQEHVRVDPPEDVDPVRTDPPADEPEPEQEVRALTRTTTGRAAIRKHPRPDAALAGYVDQGHQLGIVREVDGWAETSSGRWIQADLLD